MLGSKTSQDQVITKAQFLLIICSWIGLHQRKGAQVYWIAKNVQERKIDGIKLLPGHIQDLVKSETTARTFCSPAIFHQGQPQKSSLRERRVLSHGQQINIQKKEAEKNKPSESSPKIFQRLPTERSLINCKSRKRDISWSCTSETALSFKRDDRKLSYYRKKRMKCRQCPQSAEAGSHFSRSIQRQSRSSAYRSKSWCVELTERSVSRESSNSSLREATKVNIALSIYTVSPQKKRMSTAMNLTMGGHHQPQSNTWHFFNCWEETQVP